MANITLHGNNINSIGELPAIGSEIKDFKLIDKSLGEKTLQDFAGKRKILNIFPSIDTGTCAASVREYSCYQRIERSAFRIRALLCRRRS